MFKQWIHMLFEYGFHLKILKTGRGFFACCYAAKCCGPKWAFANAFVEVNVVRGTDVLIFNFASRLPFCVTRLSVWNILNQSYNTLVNGSISVWICGVGQYIRDILLNYSQRIFGAQTVTSLQHDCLSSNLNGQNGFLSPRHLPQG